MFERHETARLARAWLVRRQAEGVAVCAVPRGSLLASLAAAKQAAPTPSTGPQDRLPRAAPPQPSARPASPPACLTIQARAEALAELRERLLGCRACKLHGGRTNVVVGSGKVGAKLMWVGEGPGRDEDLQGEPFVGEAGRLLDRMMVAMGLTRRESYIANIVKCRPPRNRDPEPDEVAACVPHVRRQVELVNPQVIVALGRFAAQTLLDTQVPIGRLRGHWQAYPGGAQAVMPTFHPAYLLRNPSAKKLVWQDLQAVIKALS